MNIRLLLGVFLFAGFIGTVTSNIFVRFYFIWKW